MDSTTLNRPAEETETMISEHQLPNKDPESPESLCGIGAFKPRCLQWFATIQSFVGFSAVSNLTTLSVKMYLISQITTLERRFGFSSSKSGFILSSSQIGFVLCVLFVAHAGRNAHIPRILSVAAAIIGLTGLVFAGVHFLPLDSSDTTVHLNQTISGAGNISSAKDLCELRTENGDQYLSNCSENTEDFSHSGVVAMAIFVVAMLVQGAASAPRAPLGGTYVDDNNPVPTKSGKYVGIMVGIFTLAPVFSFGMGALSSRLYHTLQPTDLTPRDPRWIGAWWLGFTVLGAVTCLMALFVFCFPKRLKSARPRNVEHGSTKVEKTKSQGCGNLKRNIIGPLSGSVRLLRNRVFTCIALCGTFQTCAFIGMASFITKYIETQFYVPAYKTNLMMGAMSLLGSSLGPVVGGFVTSRYKLSLSGNIHLILVVSIFLTVVCPIGMLVGGQQTHLIKHDLPGGPNAISESCVSKCFCRDDVFRPICGSDDATYFSPCHAGCFSRENETYTNCTCTTGTATSGYCAQEDSKVYAMLMFLTLNSFALTFTLSPTYMVFIRSVSEEDKALALGLSSFMTTVLGHFPGPILYGYLVDSACILWRNSSSGRGACDLYNIEDFRLRMFGTNMALFFFAALLVFAALVVHKFQKKMEVEKEMEL